MRGAFQSEPNALAVFPSLKARRFSVRTKVPGDIYQLESEAFFGQDQNSWRYFPIWARGVIRPEPKFLPVFTNLHAMRFSVRTKVPGDIYQLKCEAPFGQNRNPWRRLPV